jgi:hypothetical protein
MSNDDSPPGGFRASGGTPARGVAVLDAEVVHLRIDVDRHDKRMRNLEQWQAALAGVTGAPGAIQKLSEEMEEMRSSYDAKLAAVHVTQLDHGTRITGVEHITFKIVATAGVCSLLGGALAAFVFKLIG